MMDFGRWEGEAEGDGGKGEEADRVKQKCSPCYSRPVFTGACSFILIKLRYRTSVKCNRPLAFF